MINRGQLKDKILTYKTQIKNIVSLSVLQGLNFLIPLFVFPYLFNILGAEYFGLVSFATAFIFYFQLFLDFGYNLSASRNIALNRDNPRRVAEIYSTAIYSKLMLMLLGGIVLGVSVYTIPKLSLYGELYFYYYMMTIGQTFFSVWLFQGLEKMENITYLNIISKGLSVALIFLLVKSKEDYILVPLLYGVGNWLAAVVSMLIIRYKYDIRLVRVSCEAIKSDIIEAFPFFVSNVSVSLYTFTTTLILGFLYNDIVVGYFTLAERIVAALKSIISPISQALYPYINVKSKEGIEVVRKFNYKFLMIVGGGMALLCGMLFVTSPMILEVFFREEGINALHLLRIMTPIPVIIVVDTVLVTFALLVFGYSKYYSKVVFCVGILNLVLAPILIYFYEAVGASISILLSELLVMVLLYLYCKKYKLTPIR